MKALKRALMAGAFASALWVSPALANDLREDLQADMPQLMELYRDLHANPELSFQEFETAAKLAKRMRSLGFEVTEKVGKTGVVAVMENGDGPTVMLRADMDGLPVVEQTGLPYASKRVATPASGIETGVMHAAIPAALRWPMSTASISACPALAGTAPIPIQPKTLL